MSKLATTLLNEAMSRPDPAAAGSVLSGYYQDYCDQSGQELDEIGWGVDSPEHIAAIEAGWGGVATEADVALIVSAIDVWADASSGDFDYVTPEFVQAYKTYGGTVDIGPGE